MDGEAFDATLQINTQAACMASAHKPVQTLDAHKQKRFLPAQNGMQAHYSRLR
jgi:hypothetical protein